MLAMNSRYYIRWSHPATFSLSPQVEAPFLYFDGTLKRKGAEFTLIYLEELSLSAAIELYLDIGFGQLLLY